MDVISSSLIATTILGAAVVQLVRMPPCHGGGRGFEPRPLRHFLILLLNFYFHSANISKIASLAQLVEHITLNDGVVGSNPTRGTIFFCRDSFV